MEKPQIQKHRVRHHVSAACDACRSRKVKCVASEDESKCSMCRELDIDCTSDRPRKKRGPKNRYVQSLRARLDGDNLGDCDSKHYDLSLIAPYKVLDQLIDDWFNLIHPVAPILLRGQIINRIQANCRGESAHSLPFFLLVASICAATCASLPRRRQYHGTVTVESCLELTERFNLWSTTNQITLERALTVYNFGSAVQCVHGIDAALTYRLLGESTVCVKYLMHNQLNQMSFTDQQVLKRLYWLVFASQCTGEMHGRRLHLLHHAHETSDALFPMPISDEQLSNGLGFVPTGLPTQDFSYIAGLNTLSRLFLIWQSSQAIAVQTTENLQEHISRAHQALVNVPPELLWVGGVSQAGDFGFDVQKVNLKVTQLHIRSNLLEQMNAIAKDQKFPVTPDAIIDEQHLVVDELLEVLYTMPEEVFDANGYSIVPKIRDIGSALLDELRTGEQGRTLQTRVSLKKLLVKLEHLDLWPIAQGSYLGS